MRELPPNNFAELTSEYAKEGKRVVGYKLYDAGDSDGYQTAPRLEVMWVYSEILNGHGHA